MDLFPFQTAAASQIATRFKKYMQDPLAVTRRQLVPFYQNLSSITGSGKTVILADAVEQIRSQLSVEPIVLWLSKGRIVVWQTLTNLATGKYNSLVGEFDIKPLLECTPESVADSSRGLLLVATVGRFNQRDKEEGDRRIFRVRLDIAEQSLWDQLKDRRDRQGRRRPLIIVYDEGHNLSDQQTQLLMELMPDALIAASATTRVPQALSSTIDRLRRDKHWTDDDLVTKVRSSEVVSSGLVKQNIMLGGYLTPMELAINDMLAEMKDAERAAHDLGLPVRPKAIYVATTNVPEGGTMREDAARPFNERHARPIQIWRHLVENAKVDPAEIAVYCDLRFDPKFPAPKGFTLFAGGDSDYDTFIVGKYKHIIFNLGLQEGWDEPECAFAYIDKDMGSPDQVTQIVGRVLRQPGAQHYPAPSLNTAHFYIRTDERGVFEAILDDVERKLAADSPEINLIVRRTDKGGSRTYTEATKQRQVPTVSIDSSEARAPIGKIVDRIVDFTSGGPSTVGVGGRIQVLQTIGQGTTQHEEWVEVEHSNSVTARWILRREIQQLFPAHGDRARSPINVCDIEQRKFDALVQYNSAAADHLREQARNIVRTYVERSKLVQNALDHPYVPASIAVDEAKLVHFKNAIHRGYSDLNNDECAFAEALDKTKRVWCRNPSKGGFSIPLLDHGNTKTFSPDFLVWLDKLVFALDTKGDHLITEDAGRKLFDIEPVEDGLLLVVRLITKGEWTIAPTGEFSKKSGSIGHTVWRLRNGRVHPTHCETIGDAVEACLQK